MSPGQVSLVALPLAASLKLQVGRRSVQHPGYTVQVCCWPPCFLLMGIGVVDGEGKSWEDWGWDGHGWWDRAHFDMLCLTLWGWIEL